MSFLLPLQKSLTAFPFISDDFSLRTLAVRERMPRGIFRYPAGIHAYFFVLCHQETMVILDGIKTACPAGSVIIWEPGDVQEYGRADESWMQSYLDCEGALIRARIAELPLRTPILCPQAAIIEESLAALAHEITNRQAPDPVITRNLLEIWLRELYLLTTAENPTARDIPIGPALARAYIEEHFTEEITLHDLADQVNMSVTHLRREFKRYFHTSPIQYLVQVRLRRACTLLYDHQLSIAQVAAHVGYPDANYFSVLFKKHYGLGPFAWRHQTGDTIAEEYGREERRLREFHQWLQEGWTLVTEADFSREDPLDARLRPYWHGTAPYGHTDLHPAPELTQVSSGLLHLQPISQWVCLRWEEDIAEEARWELTVDNTTPGGVNLCLSLSGDLQTGYRLRIYRSMFMALETVYTGEYEILMPAREALPDAAEYQISFRRSGNTFIVDINGKRMLTYHAPLPPTGPCHRACAIGRYEESGHLSIRQLQLLSRKAPRYVDILEPGRAMLRREHWTSAAAWFEDLLRTQQEAEILREARYLSALAIAPEDGARKEAALRQVAHDEKNPFRLHAWRDLGTAYLRRRNIPGAIEVAQQIVRYAPHDPTPQQIADHLTGVLETMSAEERRAMLPQIRQLPVSRLRLSNLALHTIAPIQGMRLTELAADGNYLTDLSPIAGMPLQFLDITRNALTDLTPLRGLPLRNILCSENAISDLSPLRGMTLCGFGCWNNRISQLSPLRGMPLETMSCTNNIIESLTPLANMPLSLLRCDGNRISDLSPLHTTPLRILCIGDNPITDLRPLRGLPITSLDLGSLCLDTFNDHVITALPLTRLLHLTHTPRIWALLADLPNLQSLNYHTIAHTRMLAEPLARAVTAWQHNAAVSPRVDPGVALRAYAHEATTAAYLAIPLAFTRDEAEAFCAWQGGHLPTPGTPEQQQALDAYLMTVIEDGQRPQHHIGLSDAMFALPFWQTPADKEIAQRTGCASFQVSTTTGEGAWQGEVNGNARHYLVIQWG